MLTLSVSLAVINNSSSFTAGTGGCCWAVTGHEICRFCHAVHQRSKQINTKCVTEWIKKERTGFLSSSVGPQSSVPFIYYWLTSCADLYLHYLPSFHHKPQIYDFSECQGPKNLVYFFALSSPPLSLSRSFSRGFIPPPCLSLHPRTPLLLLAWCLIVEKVTVVSGVIDNAY